MMERKHCAHKEVVFLWSVLQKGMAINEWQGRISNKEDQKNPSHCFGIYLIMTSLNLLRNPIGFGFFCVVVLAQ